MNQVGWFYFKQDRKNKEGSAGNVISLDKRKKCVKKTNKPELI